MSKNSNNTLAGLIEKGYRIVDSVAYEENSNDNTYRTIINYTGDGVLVGSVIGWNRYGDYSFRYVVDGLEVFGGGSIDPFRTHNGRPGESSYSIAIPFKKSIRVDIKSRIDPLLNCPTSATISCCIYIK